MVWVVCLLQLKLACTLLHSSCSTPLDCLAAPGISMLNQSDSGAVWSVGSAVYSAVTSAKPGNSIQSKKSTAHNVTRIEELLLYYVERHK